MPTHVVQQSSHRLVEGLWARRRGLSEIGLVVGLYVLYTLGRTFADQDLVDARHRSLTIQHTEQFLHIDVEHWINSTTSSITWLGVGMSFWYASLHYIVTPAILIWGYLRHQEVYSRMRNALVVASLIGLAIYVLVPTAPPRLMGSGFVDTLSEYSSYGWWSDHASAPAGLGGLTNELAAMPSLHVGWTVWVAWSAGLMAGRKALMLGWAYVAGTTFVVLGTGNHWLLDTVAGGLVTGMGVVISGQLPWLRVRLALLAGELDERLARPALVRLRHPLMTLHHQPLPVRATTDRGGQPQLDPARNANARSAAR